MNQPYLHYTTVHHMRSTITAHVSATRCQKWIVYEVHMEYNAVIVKVVRFMKVHSFCCFLHMDCHFIVCPVLVESRRHWRILLFHCPVSSVVNYVVSGTCVTWLSHDIHTHLCVYVCIRNMNWSLTYVCAATSPFHQFGVVWEEVIVFAVIRQQYVALCLPS